MKACLIGHNLTNFVLSKVLVKKAIKVELCYRFKNKKTFILKGLLEFQEINWFIK